MRLPSTREDVGDSYYSLWRPPSVWPDRGSVDDRRSRVTGAFGRVLRERRLTAGITQEALAAQCGLHPTYISQLERGLNRRP